MSSWWCVYHKRTCQTLTSLFLQIKRANRVMQSKWDWMTKRKDDTSADFIATLRIRCVFYQRERKAGKTRKPSKESGRPQIRGGHIMLIRIITIKWQPNKLIASLFSGQCVLNQKVNYIWESHFTGNWPLDLLFSCSFSFYVPPPLVCAQNKRPHPDRVACLFLDKLQAQTLAYYFLCFLRKCMAA